MALYAKDDNDQSTWYHLIKYKKDIVVFLDLKVFNSDNSWSNNSKVTFVEEQKLKKSQNYKHWYKLNTWSDKALKGTILWIRYLCTEITLTLPLRAGQGGGGHWKSYIPFISAVY